MHSLKKKDDKLFVAKTIFLQSATEKERESTRKEIAVLKSMKHPCIVGFEESFDEPDGARGRQGRAVPFFSGGGGGYSHRRPSLPTPPCRASDSVSGSGSL